MLDDIRPQGLAGTTLMRITGSLFLLTYLIFDVASPYFILVALFALLLTAYQAINLLILRSNDRALGNKLGLILQFSEMNRPFLVAQLPRVENNAKQKRVTFIAPTSENRVKETHKETEHVDEERIRQAIAAQNQRITQQKKENKKQRKIDSPHSLGLFGSQQKEREVQPQIITLDEYDFYLFYDKNKPCYIHFPAAIADSLQPDQLENIKKNLANTLQVISKDSAHNGFKKHTDQLNKKIYYHLKIKSVANLRFIVEGIDVTNQNEALFIISGKYNKKQNVNMDFKAQKPKLALSIDAKEFAKLLQEKIQPIQIQDSKL